MAENLLNINLYVSKALEQASPLKKSYVDNTDSSFDFDKVFDCANKTYNADKATLEASTAYKPADNQLEKENFNKLDEKKSYDDSSRIKEKDENRSQKEEVSKKSDDENDSDESENKKESEEEQTVESKTAVQESSVANTIVETLVGQAVSMLKKTVDVQSSTEQTAAVATETTSPLEQTLKANTANDNLKVDLSNLPQNVKDTTDPKGLKAKVQAEVQQLLMKLNIKADDNALQGDSKTLQADVNGIGANVSTEAKSQAPFIQVSAEVMSKVTNGANPKKVMIKDMLAKAALTQDILDKTNATVVGVETSSSSSTSSGGLLNQQNAKEHGVKLALGSLDNTGSASANITGQASQINFDKKLEAAQAPKELNKSDILSQIHSKLEQAKDEGTTKLTIILKPESLGKINLELINGKDGLTARMTTENAQVKELLDKSLDSLKSSLASQGVNVGNITVKVAEAEKQSNDMFTFDQRQPDGSDNQNSSGFSNSGDSSGTYSERTDQGYFQEEVASDTESLSSDNIKLSHDGKIDYKI